MRRQATTWSRQRRPPHWSQRRRTLPGRPPVRTRNTRPGPCRPVTRMWCKRRPRQRRKSPPKSRWRMSGDRVGTTGMSTAVAGASVKQSVASAKAITASRDPSTCAVTCHKPRPWQPKAAPQVRRRLRWTKTRGPRLQPRPPSNPAATWGSPVAIKAAEATETVAATMPSAVGQAAMPRTPGQVAAAGAMIGGGMTKTGVVVNSGPPARRRKAASMPIHHLPR